MGVTVSVIDTDTVEALIAANATQAGCGLAGAHDDSAELEEVLSGAHPWRNQVAAFSTAGGSAGPARQRGRRLGGVGWSFLGPMWCTATTAAPTC